MLYTLRSLFPNQHGFSSFNPETVILDEEGKPNKELLHALEYNTKMLFFGEDALSLAALHPMYALAMLKNKNDDGFKKLLEEGEKLNKIAEENKIKILMDLDVAQLKSAEYALLLAKRKDLFALKRMELKKKLAEEASKLSNEYANQLKDSLDKIADWLPEQNSWIFAIYTMLLPVILKEVVKTIGTTLPQSDMSGPLSGYLDSGCSLVTGCLLLDKVRTHHRPIVTAIKGFVHIANSVQLTALTAIGFAAFGAPSFAAGLGIGFVLSIEETACSMRRYFDPKYWLKDSFAQLDQLPDQIAQLKREIINLEAQIEAQNLALQEKNKPIKPKEHTWVWRRKKARLKELEVKQQELKSDILTRLLLSETTDEKLKSISERIKEAKGDQIKDQQFINDLHQIKTNALNIPQYDTLSRNLKLLLPTSTNQGNLLAHCQKRNNKIKQKGKTKILNNISQTTIWGIAFTGMLLICIPTPATILAGTILVGIASTLFALKNIPRLVHFFSKKENAEETFGPKAPLVKPT